MILKYITHKINNNHIVFFAFIGLMFISPVILNITYFETNDDFGMMLIAEGNFSGKPETDLIYTSTILGYFLKILYILVPTISWYAILQLFLNFMAFYSLLLFIKSKIARTVSQKMKFILISILVILPWSLYPQFLYAYQFTVTSIIATGIGFIIFIHGSPKQSFLSVLLILAGLSWRPVAGISILAILAFIFICNQLLYKNKFIYILYLKKILILSFIIALQFSVDYALDYSKNQTSRSFSEFNNIRGALQGYQPTQKVAISKSEAKKTVEWSTNDYDLFFYGFFYGDKSVYSTSKLQNLSDIQNNSKGSNFYYSALKKLLVTIYLDYLFYYIFLFLFSLILIFLSNKAKIVRLLSVFAVNHLLFLLYLYIVNLQGRLPGRVVFPALIVFSISLALPFLMNLTPAITDEFKQKRNFFRSYLTNILYPLKEIIKKNVFLLLSFALIYLFWVLFLGNNTRIKMFLGIFIVTLLSIIVIFCKFIDSMILFVVLLILYSIFSINADTFSNLKSRVIFRNMDPSNYESVINYSYDKPIIAFSSFYTPLMDQNQFESPLKREFFSNVIHIGTSLYSNPSLDQLARLGLSDNLFLDLAKEKAYLGVGENIQIQQVSQFILEHYNLRVVWPPAPFSYTENNIQVWKTEKIAQ
jgi:hypothetical protein